MQMVYDLGKHQKCLPNQITEPQDGTRVFNPARDQNWIHAISVSSSMVVVVCPGVSHVWALRTGDSYCLRLSFGPDQRISLVVSGESLALVCWPSEDACLFEVVTWTLQERMISSFSVTSASRGIKPKIM